MRYVIYLFGGWNCTTTFERALAFAKSRVKIHYERSGSIGESYAVIYDKLNQYRWLVFLESSGKIRYKLVR